MASEPAQPLFRSEALAAVSNTRFGRPAALLPLSWTVLTDCLVAMMSALILFLVTAEYARQETARGIVRPFAGDIRVRSPAPGIIQELLVREGQRVKAGDPIMTVMMARRNLSGNVVTSEALLSVESSLADLNHRLAALRASALMDKSGYGSQLQALQKELAASKNSEQFIQQQISLAQKALDLAEGVAKNGFISGEEMRRRHQEILVLNQNAAQTREHQAELERQIDQLRTTRAQHPYTVQQAEGQLLDRIASARQERDNLLAQQGFSIKAPTDGVVTALQVSRGQDVTPQQALLDLSKPGSPIIAEVYVPSRAIGFLKKGQEVRIRYDAFPYQQFGSAKGVVRAISDTVLRPEDINAPMRLNEPAYRVLVTLQKNGVSAYGKQYPVQPGSALTADIIIDRRSFAQWLLDPIIALRGHL